MRHTRSAIALACAVLLSAAPARAVDPFEIQVYDGTSNGPAVLGGELHLNYVASGAKDAAPPELPQHRVTHLTFEPSLGLLPWWEAGAYLQTALRRDGTFDYAGAKLRSKFVTPADAHRHWRLGVNVEVSLLPENYDRDRWASELRPIAAWEDSRFLLAVNPILGQSWAGAGASNGPTFEPAATALYKFENLVSMGLEYYANLGPIGSGFVPARDQEHYLYEVVNLLGIRGVEAQAGVGKGLTAASNPLVFKLILGFTWERSGQALECRPETAW